MILPSLVSGWGEEVLPPGLPNVPCATSWVVRISESMFFKGHLTPLVASVCNAPSIIGHSTNASPFLAVLGKSTGPSCSTVVLEFRPSKGNYHGTVPGDVGSCVERTSSPSWACSSALPHFYESLGFCHAGSVSSERQKIPGLKHPAA